MLTKEATMTRVDEYMQTTEHTKSYKKQILFGKKF